MHWLTIFFHYIICDINDIIDRSDTLSTKSSLHPFRWRSDLNILNNPCHISLAELCIFNLNWDIVLSLFIWLFFYFYYWWIERLVKCNSRLSCHSKDWETVYSVRCDLIFYICIIKTESCNRIISRLYISISREYIDSVFRSFWVKLTGRTKFFNGAHHTVWLYSTKFSLFDSYSVSWKFSSVVSSCNSSAIKYCWN